MQLDIGSLEMLSPSKTEPVGTWGADPLPRSRCGGAAVWSPGTPPHGDGVARGGAGGGGHQQTVGPGPEPGRLPRSCGLVQKVAGSFQKESKSCTSTHFGNCLTVSGGSRPSSPTGHRLGLVQVGASHSPASCREACCPFSRRPNWTQGAVHAAAEGDGPTHHRLGPAVTGTGLRCPPSTACWVGRSPRAHTSETSFTTPATQRVPSDFCRLAIPADWPPQQAGYPSRQELKPAWAPDLSSPPPAAGVPGPSWACRWAGTPLCPAPAEGMAQGEETQQPSEENDAAAEFKRVSWETSACFSLFHLLMI